MTVNALLWLEDTDTEFRTMHHLLTHLLPVPYHIEKSAYSARYLEKQTANSTRLEGRKIDRGA